MDMKGARPLHLAVARGDTALAKLLCEAGADKNVRAQSEFWTGTLSPPEIASLNSTKQITTEVEHAILTLALYWDRPDMKNILFIRHAESLANYYFGLRKPICVLDPRLSEHGMCSFPLSISIQARH
jgi:hypothetical protein